MSLSRRSFCSGLSALAASRLVAQQGSGPTTSRPDVASIDHDRILAAADHFLTVPVDPLTAHPVPGGQRSPNEFTSELDDNPSAPDVATAGTPFTAHRDAVLQFTLAVPALTAAWLLTRSSDPDHASRFAAHAADHLRAWFVTPATRMEPSLEYAGSAINTSGHPEGVVETSSFAEIAVAIPFLLRSGALSPQDSTAVKSWFAAFLTWLTTSRLAGLSRDQKNRIGTSWLLQCAAFARLTENDPLLADLRHRFKTVTLRAEIVGDGTFPHELTTSNPYRNSLFNLDMLAAVCDLLSTRFETLWDFQLQDGPGLRVAVARYVPYIENRGDWPYRADAHLFNDLPCRRPALLFAARAYQRPEYANLWRSLNPDPTNPTILRSFPIRQPLLWVTRPLTS